MKNKQITRPSTNTKKRKIKWNDVFITALAAVVIVGFFVWFVMHAYQQEQFEQAAKEKYEATLPSPGVAIDHKLVCMASDLFHGKDQIEVVVANETYYGCSQKAIRDITANEKMRFAIDPYSKNSIDKALAFIAINPNKTGSILYFESEENLRNYFKRFEKAN